MPVVPVYNEFAVEPNRLPEASVHAPNIEPIAAEQAYALGRSMSESASKMADVAARLMQERDDALAEEAFVKLSEYATESVYGERGALASTGAGAFGVTEKWKKDFHDNVKRISEPLAGNQNAMRKFERVAASMYSRYHSAVARHELEQIRAHKDQAFEAFLANSVSAAQLAYQDPEVVGFHLAEVAERVRRTTAYENGSPEIREMLERKAAGAVHAGIIEAALNNGNATYAKAWYDEHKAEVPPEVRARIEREISGLVDYETGKQIGLEAIGVMQKGKGHAEALGLIVKRAKTQQQDSVARRMLDDYVSQTKEAYAHSLGSLYAQFEHSPTRETMLAIIGSRQFFALDPEDRATLERHMRDSVDRLEDEEARERERIEREKYDTPEVMRIFHDILTDDKFPQMTKNQLYALVPVIGKDNVAKLLTEHDRVAAAAEKFKISGDLVMSVIAANAPQLLRPANKSKLNMVKGKVAEALIEWKSKHPGEIPDYDDQVDIVSSVFREIEVPTAWGMWHSKVPVWRLKPMPQDFITKATEEYKKLFGKEPTWEELTDLWAEQEESH